MTWFFLGMAVVQTVLAFMHWQIWLAYKSMQLEYPPEILAQAKFHVPEASLRLAIGLSVFAALLWLRAFRMIRAESKQGLRQ